MKRIAIKIEHFILKLYYLAKTLGQISIMSTSEKSEPSTPPNEEDENVDLKNPKNPKVKPVKVPAHDQLEELYKKLKEISKEATQCATSIKAVMAQVERERKTAVSTAKKGGDPRDPKTKKSGLETPVELSDVMCEFLGIEKGSKRVRNDVKSDIRAYIRNMKLQNPDNRREIVPDKKLKTILHGYKDGDELTYWTMETYLKHNFIKDNIKVYK